MSIIFAARCAEHPEKRNPKVLGIPGYGRHGLLLINGGRSEPVNGVHLPRALSGLCCGHI